MSGMPDVAEIFEAIEDGFNQSPMGSWNFSCGVNTCGFMYVLRLVRVLKQPK
jgi:hypothetical protein